MRKFEICSGYEGKAILPKRYTKDSCGYDISFVLENTVIIEPFEVKLFETGIKAKFTSDEALLIYPRSSTGIKKNLLLANGTCVIDPSYYNNENNEGNIILAFRNVSNNKVILEKGEQRLVQGIFTKYFTVTDEEMPIKKRSGGVGSTN